MTRYHDDPMLSILRVYVAVVGILAVILVTLLCLG